MLYWFEAEILPGIEPLALAELRRIADDIDHVGAGAVRFRFTGALSTLTTLRMSTTICSASSTPASTSVPSGQLRRSRHCA